MRAHAWSTSESVARTGPAGASIARPGPVPRVEWGAWRLTPRDRSPRARCRPRCRPATATRPSEGRDSSRGADAGRQDARLLGAELFLVERARLAEPAQAFELIEPVLVWCGGGPSVARAVGAMGARLLDDRPGARRGSLTQRVRCEREPLAAPLLGRAEVSVREFACRLPSEPLEAECDQRAEQECQRGVACRGSRRPPEDDDREDDR